MNKWVPIIKSIEKSIVRIVVFSEGEIVSEGTGTIINKLGWILTGYHVVDMLPDYEKYRKECRIFVFTVNGRFEYLLSSRPFAIGMSLIENTKLEFDVDIAVLSPSNYILFENYLPPVLESINVDLGEDVIMCGYSEETPNLVDLAKVFGKEYDKLTTPSQREEIALLKGSLKPATFKSGIISHAMHIFVNESIVHYQILHIDNGVHGGMSGGPIINSHGEFIGIITQRTVIHANVMSDKKIIKFEVPSGNSIGITLNYLSVVEGFLENYNNHK